MAAALLAVVSGPRAGLVVPVRGQCAVIGRAAGCDLVLPDADTSRRHASVDLRSGRLYVTDLGSTNGTLVDGVPAGPAPVPPGAVLRIGENAVRVEAAHAPPPVASGPAPPDAVTLARQVAAGHVADGGRGLRLGSRPGRPTVPVCVDLRQGSLGLAGPPVALAGPARWLVTQALAQARPPRLVLALADSARGRWTWCAGRAGHVAVGARQCSALVTALAADTTATGATATGATATLLVCDLADTPVDHAPLAALLRDPRSPVTSLVVGGFADVPPALCRQTARLTGDAGTRALLDGRVEVVLDGVSEQWASAVTAGRHMSSSSGPIS